ncbi:hypothetical protein [Deefgea sp. CFH1-16]|nr:hypothetical protein [Deefgea sp. CFH1-16]
MQAMKAAGALKAVIEVI